LMSSLPVQQHGPQDSQTSLASDRTWKVAFYQAILA
jgi:hypothetical protein